MGVTLRYSTLCIILAKIDKNFKDGEEESEKYNISIGYHHSIESDEFCRSEAAANQRDTNRTDAKTEQRDRAVSK